MQWVFDKRIAFGESASHLSLVSSGATDIVAKTNEELSALAAREVEASLPGARGLWPIRATVVREKQATFSLAPGQPRAPGHADRASPACSSPATGPTPACRPRSRARWSAGIGRRRQWWSDAEFRRRSHELQEITATRRGVVKTDS